MSEAAAPKSPWLPDSVRALKLILVLAFRADLVGTILLCLSLPLSYVSPAFGALAVKALIESDIDSASSVAWAATLAGLAAAAAFGSMQLSVYLIHVVGKKIDLVVQRQLTEMLAGLPGIEHFERPDVFNQIQVLRKESGIIGVGITATLSLFGTVFQAVIACVLLAAQTPLLLLLLLFALPSFVIGGISNRWIRVAQEETAESDRLLHRFVAMAGEMPVAREARLFRLGTELRDRRRRLANHVDQTQGRALTRSTLLSAGGDLVFAVGYLGAVALVVARTLAGELTVGDVIVTLVLAGQTQGFVSGLVNGVRDVASVCIVGAKMEWLSRYRRTQARDADTPTAEPPRRLTEGIRLDKVSFTYPGTSKEVLSDVSLVFEPGTVVGLVGENGAGKTSLVKLLLGLYQPTSGRVQVDGQDLSGIDPEAWRRRTSGAFQDFCRPEFRARECIGMGDVERMDDEDAVLTAVRRGTAEHVIAGLAHGLDAQLGSSWKAGVDLSGGEWQRLSLARGQMRRTPLLLVMDEPTASLDTEAEHQIFLTFASAAKDVAEVGGITLLITHRFSSVQMADQIVVLDEGRVREVGTHHELVRRNGLYAELFDLQAEAYR
ncbi:ABC transporter ATP-binding protein [Actinopolymorpha alba]|uniref:ABC transporter ATP-binding protein n=1 Tax=Actinopolymorpha alba TaxID=533267 RepID=UPI000367B0A2|nr:ABC transporter ATP-binding protein [Actinopolymorpha alba]